MPHTERTFSVNGLTIAALCWGDEGAIPVLALHGWLDNAASFERLAPQLDGCHVVAIDMPGHGHSSHRFPQGSYNLWDDLLDLLALADQLGWQKFHLLGHSRGAMIAFLLAVAAPERIASLSLLDGMLPLPVKPEDYVDQLQRHVRDYRRAGGPGSKIYAAFDEALLARCQTSGMSELTARPIVERGLETGSLGLRWRHDTRVMAASAVKLTQTHLDAVVKSLQVPTLLLLAENGVSKFFADMLTQIDAHPFIQQTVLKGSHHFHLEPDVVPLIARVLLEHFDRNVSDSH